MSFSRIYGAWFALAATLLLLLIGLTSCDKTTGSGGETKVTDPPLVLAPAPNFNADTAYWFVQQQVNFGPRVPNTPAHQQCADFLLASLQRYGLKTHNQAFEVAAYNGTILRSRNLIGAINPNAKKRILLCAHWDSRHVADHDKDSANWQKPILGANDGGSGVGVLLEIARLMAPDSAKLGFGVDFIFFDSEDHGQPEFDRSVNNPDSWCLGSKHWAQNKHVPGYQGFYGILLDMVGAPGAKFYQEGVSLEYAPSIVQKVWNIGHQLGYGAFFIRESTDGIIDDHRYINEMAGIPTIDIVQYHSASGGFHPSWHTQGDNMDVIDRATLKAVGQTVLQTLYNETAPAQPLN